TATASNQAGRAWLNNTVLSDVQVTAALHIDSLNPAQIFARGTGLGGASPSATYYAVQVVRGLTVKLVKMSSNTQTDLTSAVTSAAYTSGIWANVTLDVEGSTIQARVFRLDTNQYLDNSGNWQNYPVWAVTATDTSITGLGQVGLARPAQYT